MRFEYNDFSNVNGPGRLMREIHLRVNDEKSSYLGEKF